MDNVKLLDILGRIPLFNDLSESDRKVIVAMPKAFDVFSAGDVIVREGEKEACFYILLTGIAKVFLNGQELATLRPPQFVGEVGFICNEPRIATVIAKEQVMAMKLDAANFSKLPGAIREAVKDRIIAGLIARLSDGNQSLMLLRSRNKYPTSVAQGMRNMN
ncbi:cyclic nucleotide-binding domain-containing protein [Planctobacterium marinum]|uniref:cyclic nucleotide-binding domain-containing protein n=1 Tax=Planctobacterium marinum TaxID=1631968 RepID=UPI001E603E4B|nr:cyclic nucleotide-binding domain-containing protein [Planctobacterium marinum]MCC2603926.1 cyclic nucleotide-binding domain-containing protein [Planctobacterium marinum]